MYDKALYMWIALYKIITKGKMSREFAVNFQLFSEHLQFKVVRYKKNVSVKCICKIFSW